MSCQVFNRNILGKKIDIRKLKSSNAFIRMKNGVVSVAVYFSVPDVSKDQLRDVGFILIAILLPYNENLASILKVEGVGIADGEIAKFIDFKANEFVKTYMYKKGA